MQLLLFRELMNCWERSQKVVPRSTCASSSYTSKDEPSTSGVKPDLLVMMMMNRLKHFFSSLNKNWCHCHLLVSKE